ncbi:E3 ubiquitin-protein ligase ZNRF1 isoform X3 [Tamandua tetradactyla]|uniref:E3 ubiquitin-protein ligase ZNRF1 isoform X3 n=1 Tax=Tamandua tetradactyla TaxID=48850 RepID=UPI0040541BF6
MGGKQSTAARSRGPFPGVSTDDSAVPPPGGAPHFGHYRTGGGAMGLRSRSVSSVAGMGMDPSTAGGVPFGLYTPASRGTGDSERAPSGGGSASDSTYAHGNGYQETGGGHHRDGMLYLGSRASLADALPLHIAPRWFSSHSGLCCSGDSLELSPLSEFFSSMVCSFFFIDFSNTACKEHSVNNSSNSEVKNYFP